MVPAHRRSPRRRAGCGCAPRRRPGSRRAPTPRSSTWRHRPLRRAGGRLGRPARGGHGRRPGRAARPAPGHACARSGSTACSAPTLDRARRSPGCWRPIGFAADRSAGDDDARSPIPSWRYDSSTEIDVVEEVARHHGYASIGKRRAAVRPRRPPHRAPARAAPAAVAAGGPGPVRGHAAAVPGPGRPGARAACRTTASRSPTRWWPRSRCCARRCCPGLVKALATNAARRNTGVGLWEIGHVFRRPPAGGEAEPLPDEREVLGVALGGRDAAEAVHEWRAVAEVLALRGRRAWRNGAVPGLHPTRVGRAGRPGRRGGGRGRRGRPRACSRPTASASGSGWLEVDLDVGRRPAPRPARLPAGQRATRRATSTWPSRSTTPCRPATSRRTLRDGRGRPAGVAAPVRRLPGRGHRRGPPQPGLHAAARRPRPHADRRRGGRGPPALHRGGRGGACAATLGAERGYGSASHGTATRM